MNIKAKKGTHIRLGSHNCNKLTDKQPRGQRRPRESSLATLQGSWYCLVLMNQVFQGSIHLHWFIKPAFEYLWCVTEAFPSDKSHERRPVLWEFLVVPLGLCCRVQKSRLVPVWFPSPEKSLLSKKPLSSFAKRLKSDFFHSKYEGIKFNSGKRMEICCWCVCVCVCAHVRASSG